MYQPLKIQRGECEEIQHFFFKVLPLKQTHRHVHLNGHSIELQVQRIVGAGQGRETSRPVQR